MAAIITALGTVMTAILGYIPDVLTAIMGTDMFAFVIYASIVISVIYFVVRLLKGFTGNKLVGGRKRR